MKHYLIISHGSKLPEWGDNVIRLTEELDDELSSLSISYAFLDSTPNITNSLRELEAKGIDDIVLIPLFLAPSSHMNIDIPVIVGLNSNTELINKVVSKDYDIYSGNALINLEKPLMYQQSFIGMIVDQIGKRISQHKCNKVVLLSHGSSEFKDDWDEFINALEKKIKSGKDVETASFYVGTGKNLIDITTDYFKSIKFGEKVLVFGLYLGYGSDHLINKNINAIYEQGLEEYYLNPNNIWTNDCISKIDGFKTVIKEIILSK